MSRYARQEILAEVGATGQARLGAARVLVVGAGGLGASALPLLAGAGVGALRVLDPDRIEESNLHRQVLYRMADLGAPKAEIAARELARLNPGVAVEARVGRLDPGNAPGLLEGVDLVLDLADSFAVTYTLSDLCAARGVPMISASVQGWRGYAGGFCGGGPSYRALFPEPPERAESCAGGGVMGPAVAALGATAAQIALSVLLGRGGLGQLITLDFARWRMGGFRFEGAEEPVVPLRFIAEAEIGAGDCVIDLRAAAPGVPVPGRRAVFVCASGLRAWRAAAAHVAAGGVAAMLAAGE